MAGNPHFAEILPDVPGQQDMAPRLLNGSQAKTAYALRKNAERMIAEGGLNSTGFLTLTIGEHVCHEHGEQEATPQGRCPICKRKLFFQQVHDAAEASRRINNLNRRLLADLFERCIVVTERHKSKAIHFHVLGILRGRPDIRTGYNFDQTRRRDYRSASPWLKGTWAMLRSKLPGYGFGRSELTPIRKTSVEVASYVSKYIEKNIYNRTPSDKRKKLVRYLGWEKSQLKPNEFSWAGKRAAAWRGKAKELASLINCGSREEFAEAMGPRWAFNVSLLVRHVSDAPVPLMEWENYEQRERIRNELIRASGVWMVKRERDAEWLAKERQTDASEYGGRLVWRFRPDSVVNQFDMTTASSADNGDNSAIRHDVVVVNPAAFNHAIESIACGGRN